MFLNVSSKYSISIRAKLLRIYTHFTINMAQLFKERFVYKFDCIGVLTIQVLKL